MRASSRLLDFLVRRQTSVIRVRCPRKNAFMTAQKRTPVLGRTRSAV
jgi:hypothetical protein